MRKRTPKNHTGEYHIGDAMNAFMEQANLAEQAAVRRVISQWHEVAGKAIADQTEAVWFKAGVFHVQIRTPSWKNELILRRQELCTRINEWAGRVVAQEVKIL